MPPIRRSKQEILLPGRRPSLELLLARDMFYRVIAERDEARARILVLEAEVFRLRERIRELEDR